MVPVIRSAFRKKLFFQVLFLSLSLPLVMGAIPSCPQNHRFLPPLSRSQVLAGQRSRFAYLEEDDPYYVSRLFPKLVTPQWIGEEGVEAVVVLSIDDLGDATRYERFLRPILDRLKKIDGRAALSITTNRIDPALPQLQKWLDEGVSLDTHTTRHACPMLHSGNLAAVKEDYDRCVDLLFSIPGNRPVAFRVPCCDSMNATSPRFFTEIFSRTTPAGNFLTLSSSVFQIFTSNDPELPRDLVVDANGLEKFAKYIPSDRAFANYVEDYPYPYVISRLCWELPAVMPSDWDAQHYQQPNNPFTVEDLQAAIDATVLKQGVFTLVFHPHGWIRNDQLVELIDHAVHRYGNRVKFLSFREVQERIDKNLLAGHPLRNASGGDNGVRLLDLDGDGYLDVVIANEHTRMTRIWSPEKQDWIETTFPLSLGKDDFPVSGNGVKFGSLGPKYPAVVLYRNETGSGAWCFDGTNWNPARKLLAGLEVDGNPVFTSIEGKDQGVRFRDLDHDGFDEILVGNPRISAVFRWSEKEGKWRRLPYGLPPGTRFVDTEGRDAGLRLVDIDEDGFEDVLFSNEAGYCLDLFDDIETGWTVRILEGKRLEQNRIPMISRHGTNNGVWFHSRTIWVNNEDTSDLPDHVERVEFNDLLKSAPSRPRSPESSLVAWKPRPGFEVELVASEPLVMDPVAIDWGADGKLWVAEMADYPEGVHGNYEPGGRIRFLEDTDGDGCYDRSTVFLDEVPFPSGVMAYKNGVLVTAAPDVFYAEDTDGDGRADVREVLYTGFGSWNQQHLVNGLRWGLDNWIHLANGDSGGKIRSVKTGEEIDIRGRDLRIRPEEGLIETEYGQTQYGRSRDDWGNWFGCSNPNPMWHFVLNDHYIRRNRRIAAPNPKVDVSVTPGTAPVFPVSRTLPRFNDPWAANRFTSACSTMVYRDVLFGPMFEENAFVCEPVHNLVHREIMAAQGVTFTSRRAPDEKESEFLASTDNWCRPVMVRTGPDGALWVVDMYREQIEHPQFIPEELRKGVDFRAGDHRGRIFRVYPVRSRPRPIPRLDGLSTENLVPLLDTPNGTQRDRVHRFLLERKDPDSIPLLSRLVVSSTRAVTRMQALCVLEGLDGLTVDLLDRALQDPHPGVRRHAIRLSEPFLDNAPSLGRRLLDRVTDTDPQVILQLAYSFGEWHQEDAGKGLGRLAVAHAQNRFIRKAVLSSVGRENLPAVAKTVLHESRGRIPSSELLSSLLSLSIAWGNRETVASLLEPVVTPREGRYETRQVETLTGFLDGLERRNLSLDRLRESASDSLKEQIDRIEDLFEYARSVVEDEESPEEDCIVMLQLVGRGGGDPDEAVETLRMLLAPQSSLKLKEAAVEALSRIHHPGVPGVLLSEWKNFGLEMRTKILGILLGRKDWTESLLEAVENGTVLPREIDAHHRERLLTHGDKEIREKAASLFGTVIDPDRARVIEEYRSALSLSGDENRGKEVFKKRCATCHLLRGEGTAIGPNLAALSDKSPQSLLISILDPNRNVENKFLNYVAETYQGETLTGLLSEETGNSITLIGADGKEVVVLREDLESLRSTDKSFMPEGLEADLSPQDLADLFVWIAGSGPKRRNVPGVQPAKIRPEPFRGALWLLATNGEIYGENLRLDRDYDSLADWVGVNDFTVWSFEVTEPYLFNILLDYSCADDSAGNSYQIEVAGKRFTGEVEGTGTWENYRIRKVGEIRLAPGEYRLVLRPLGRIEGRLLNLKGIGLRPD